MREAATPPGPAPADSGMNMFHLEWDAISDRITLSPEKPAPCGAFEPRRGADYLDRLHPDDRDGYREAISALEPARPGYCVHYRLLDDNGRECPVEERGIGRFDASRKILGRAAIVSECTPAAPSLPGGDLHAVANGGMLRRMLDTSLNGIYVHDIELRRTTFINARYSALTGYTLEDLNAMTAEAFLELFHPDDRAAVGDHMARMRSAADDEIIEIESRFRRSDGRWIWCLSADSVFERSADGSAQSIIGTFIDVTARKQADRARRESESRARTHLTEIEHIYATAPVGLCVLDRSLRFVRINERLAEINGVSREAHIGRTIRDVLPRLADNLEPRMRRVIDTGEPVRDIEIEGETPARPGVSRTWIESWLPLHDADGRIIGLNIVAGEVTAQRQAEREKTTLGALLQALFENAAAGIAQVNLDGRFIRVNQRLSEITGYSREELTQRRFHDITHPDDLGPAARKAARLQAGEIANYRMDKRYIRKDGRVQWVGLTCSMVRDAAGAPDYFVAIIDDISARRKAESRARTLAKVVETSCDFIGVAGLDGYGIYLNPAGCAMVGLDKSQVARTPIEAYLFPEDLPFVRETVMPTVLNEGRWADAFRFRHFRTGEPIDVFWDVLRIDDPASTDPALIATVTRDIREQKAREAELRAANRRKDEFLAVMGHELRNPMAPIRSAVDILLLRESGRDPQFDRTLEILDRQTLHLGRLLDDLLDISRIERGQLRLEHKPVAIREIFEQAAGGVRHLMETRGHRFEIEHIGPDLTVKGDPVRLTQILFNLLLNAANYTPEGGRILLSAEVAGDEIILRVRDNGPGLPPDMLNREFTPFSRGEKADYSAQHGLGLGLAISRSLAELHHGRLNADNNRPGPGAVVSLHLPRPQSAPAEAAPNPAPTPAMPRAEVRKVLLVEDNKDVADATALLLDVLGFRAEIATTGDQALALTENWCPRLALLDVGLPDMDGLELARRLRARCPERSTLHLVAVTGFGHEEARERSMAAGCDEHLAKPVELATLQRLLEQWG